MMDFVRATLGIVGVHLIAAAMVIGAARASAQPRQNSVEWTLPDIAALSDSPVDQLNKKGRDLIVAPPSLIGPNVESPGQRYAGNNLSCSNCHLSAGTRKFGLPLFGLADLFPQYSSRTGG